MIFFLTFFLLCMIEMHVKYFWWQVTGKTISFPIWTGLWEVILGKQLSALRKKATGFHNILICCLPDLLKTCPSSLTPEESRAEDLIHGVLYLKQERTEAFASLWTFSTVHLICKRGITFVGEKVFQLLYLLIPFMSSLALLTPWGYSCFPTVVQAPTISCFRMQGGWRYGI